MVSRFNNAKTGAPTFIFVQENESGIQGVTIQVKYCPWCGERLDGGKNDGGFCEPKRGGNLPEKYLAFVRRALNDKALVSTADVAPVVRCKDCKWFADNNGGEWYGCQMFNAIRAVPEDAPKPNDFCSYGERKDAE